MHYLLVDVLVSQSSEDLAQEVTVSGVVRVPCVLN